MLPTRLQFITLRGFRSIKELESFELGDLSLFIGDNGAGKSTLMKFFEMLSWMAARDGGLQRYVLMQGGANDLLHFGVRNTQELSCELGFETLSGANSYRFSLRPDAQDALFVDEEAYRVAPKTQNREAIKWHQFPGASRELQLPLAQGKTPRFICNLLRRLEFYHFNDTSPQAAIHRRVEVADNAYLRANGSNLASVLLALRDAEPVRYQLIEKMVRRAVPAFDGFVLEPVDGFVQLKWRTRWDEKTISTAMTSDGSLRIFCLITLLNMPARQLPDILFFDEPELGLHPHAIQLVAALLKRCAKAKQVVLATQSPYLVDCFDVDDVVIVRNVAGQTQFKHVDSSRYREWLDDEYSLSDIWVSNILEGVSSND